MNQSKMTPIQKRIVNTLLDGGLHKREELLACLGDSEGQWANVLWHLTTLRKIIRPQGYDIICQAIQWTSRYRLIRLLVNPNDGKR